MDLAELIATRRKGRTFEKLASDCGGSPSAKRLQQIESGGRGGLKNFPDPTSIRALARGLRTSETTVILAAAESLDLDVEQRLPRLVQLLPAEAAALSDEQAAALADLVRVMVPRSVSRDP